MTDPNAMAIQLAIVIEFLKREQEAQAKRRQEHEAFFAMIEAHKASYPPEYWEQVRRDKVERDGPEALEIDKEIRAVELKYRELGDRAQEVHNSGDPNIIYEWKRHMGELRGLLNLLNAKRNLAVARHIQLKLK